MFVTNVDDFLEVPRRFSPGVDKPAAIPFLGPAVDFFPSSWPKMGGRFVSPRNNAVGIRSAEAAWIQLTQLRRVNRVFWRRARRLFPRPFALPLIEGGNVATCKFRRLRIVIPGPGFENPRPAPR